MPNPIPYYPFNGEPFIINYVYGNANCSDFADPDQAGLGVVFSGVAVALPTTFASWAVFYLDRGSWQTFLSPRQKTLRRVLKRAIFTIADQQLITGIALLTSAYANMHRYNLYKEDKWDFQDAHFVLVIYQSCLSLSVFFACGNTSRKFSKHVPTTYIRAFFVIVLVLALSFTVAVSHHAFEPLFYLFQGMPGHDEDHIYKASWIQLRRGSMTVAIIFAYAISAIQALGLAHVLPAVENKGIKPTPQIGSPKAPIFQTMHTLFFTAFVIWQKFAAPREVSEAAARLGISAWCGLNNPGENEWTFGQTVAVTMLLLPILSVVEDYFEEEENVFQLDIKNSLQRDSDADPQLPPADPNRHQGIQTIVSRTSGTIHVFVCRAKTCWYKRYKRRDDSNRSNWSDWKSLGGFIDTVCAVSHDSNSIHLFARDTMGTYWRRDWNNIVWNNWESLGSPFGAASTGDICAVSRGANRLDLFVCDTGNICWHWRLNSKGCIGWRKLGDGISHISAVPCDARRIDLFKRGEDHLIYHNVLHDDSTPGQTEWTRLSREVREFPKALCSDGSQADVFVGGTGNSDGIYHMTMSDGQPPRTEWHDLCDASMSNIIPVPYSPGRVDLFALGPHNSVYQKKWDMCDRSPSRANWTCLGGVVRSQLSVTSFDGKITIVAEGMDNTLWIKEEEDGSKWADWQTLGCKVADE